MGSVLGLTESSYISIIGISLTVVIFLWGLFIRIKANSDRADTMTDVKKQLEADLKPVKKTIAGFENDLKDLKKDELDPIKADINDIRRAQGIMDVIIHNLVKTIDRNHHEMTEYSKERDRNMKENFILLFDKLDSKQDKK